MVEEEGGDASRGVDCVVVCKLCSGQVEVPVILLVVDERAEHRLEGLDGTFRLAVSLRMESR